MALLEPQIYIFKAGPEKHFLSTFPFINFFFLRKCFYLVNRSNLEHTLFNIICRKKNVKKTYFKKY